MPASHQSPELMLADALRLHRQGHIRDAEIAYRHILDEFPMHADALHLLGMLLHQTDRSEEGAQLIRRAISVQPRQPLFRSNLGVVLAGQEKFDEAIDEYQLAILLKPNSPETLNNLGVALHASGMTEQAIDCFKQAFVLQPDYADARTNLMQLLHLQPETAGAFHVLADLLFEAARPVEAAAWYQKSLSLQPESAETHNNLGNALFAAGQHVEAVPHYEQALSIASNFSQAWNNLANALKELGRIDEAIVAYQRAIELQPNSPEPPSNLGNALRELRQWDAAMECYQKALAITPDHASTHNNIGNLHCEKSEWSLAIVAYERALFARSDYADAINNLGTALEETGKRDEAMACYRRAFSLDSKLVSPPWNIALLQLLRGEYEAGWVGYENRWRQKKQSKSWRDFDQPMLTDLSAIKNARVLLHAEQGFGDAIQFCRYAPMVAALGVEVSLECPPPLARLFASLTGVNRVIARGEELPPFDLHCPLMSLPKVFGTTLETIPNEPYLRAGESDIAKWRKRFDGEPPAFRVGLVWAGQSSHQKDRHRSLTLSAFAELAQMPGVCFYSLQVGDASTQAKSPPSRMALVDWTSELHDFADTAALVSQLSLVITVDTAVGHLAGALGKPVWILIAFQPDWRWLLDREDSPWYPTARLFRQLTPDDWANPLAKMTQALRRMTPSTSSFSGRPEGARFDARKCVPSGQPLNKESDAIIRTTSDTVIK